MLEVKIPAVAESITEVEIAEWRVKDGDVVKKDQILLVIDSDKASLELAAEASGQISIQAKTGVSIKVGSVVAVIDTSKQASAPAATAAAAAPAPTTSSAVVAPVSGLDNASPAARKHASEAGLDLSNIQATGKDGRHTKADVLQPVAKAAAATPAAASVQAPVLSSKSVVSNGEREKREKMPSIRRKIASRLVMAQHTAAILTTFNEIDMSKVMALRSTYKEAFEKKHNARLGFMSFFTKATVEALKAYPMVNSYIDGEDIVSRNYFDISIAVSGKKGLLVPVLRDADTLSLADIEKQIAYFGAKAKEGSLSVEEMTGGGFTISNGGVFGSLLSTPILNPPQTGILGLHKIEDRAVVIKGEIVVRPMMYVALSYDHRIIDGAQSVGFLVKIKEMMEDPSRMLLEV